MKKFILLFVLTCCAIIVNAQVGYNYKQFAVGLDVSYERGYTNLTNQDYHIGESINFIYNYSPYIPITAELQFGSLSGGGAYPSGDKYGRQYVNQFEAFVLHADLGLGELVDYSQGDLLNMLKNFYGGTGVGLVFNNNTVTRHPSYDPTYTFPGSNSSVNPIIPLRFGYEFKLYNDYEEPWMAVDIGYVHNLVFGEGLDGYDDPSNKFKNNATNQYSQIIVGVKFSLGNVTSYSKTIRSFY